MDLIEYIKSKEQLSIDEAAVILTDIDMKNRSWSAAESYNKVREVHRLGMIERITNRLLACKNEGFIQKISDDDAMNIYGYDGSEEEYMFVKYDRSYIYSDYLIDAIERRNSEASSPECYLPGIICYYLYLNGNTDQEVILKDKIINLYQIYSNIDDDILMAKVKSLLNSKFVKHIGKFINPYIGSNIKQELDVMCQTRNDDETLVEKNKQIDAAIESLHIEVKNYESPMPITIGDAEDCDVYHFKKVGQSWEIKFDTELIKGIKHKVGMDYIKTLIGAKGEIDVLTLQAITNPQCIANKNIVDNDDENDDCVLPSQLYNIVNKNAVLKQYGDELLMLNKQRAKAELENDGLLEIEEIDRKVCLIEEQIDIIKYKKNDDPELEQNRKKVYTAISNALKNIKDMEIDAGYPDTPIYEHLKKNIETGVVCSYNPPKENSPHWLF